MNKLDPNQAQTSITARALNAARPAPANADAQAYLHGLNPEQKTRTSRAKLVEAWFDFNYFTSIYTTKAGTVYYFVYDQGYLPLEGDYYALVKRES